MKNMAQTNDTTLCFEGITNLEEPNCQCTILIIQHETATQRFEDSGRGVSMPMEKSFILDF